MLTKDALCYVPVMLAIPKKRRPVAVVANHRHEWPHVGAVNMRYKNRAQKYEDSTE